MSSYPVQFIQPNASPLEGVGEGIGQFAGAMMHNSNAKRKKEELAKKQTDFEAGIDPNKFDIEKTMNDTGGMSISQKAKKPEDFSKVLLDSLAFGGDKQMDAIGQKFGINRNEPAMSMIDGSVGELPTMSTPDYGSKISQALFPSYTPENIRAKAAGLPELPRPEKAPTPTVDSEMSMALSGKKPIQDVMNQFPTKYDEINKANQQNTPVSQAPGYTDPQGFMGFGGLTESTKTLIANIKNQYDLQEFLSQAGEYEQEGVNVDAVKAHFGVK